MMTEVRAGHDSVAHGAQIARAGIVRGWRGQGGAAARPRKIPGASQSADISMHGHGRHAQLFCKFLDGQHASCTEKLEYLAAARCGCVIHGILLHITHEYIILIT